MGSAVLESTGDVVQVLIDDGPSRYGQPGTVVRITGESWEVVREGIVSAQTLERLTKCLILFVCTGNTCRSPLAEVLCKKLLAEQLGCAPHELAERGFVVLSAGISAMMGGGATPEAIETARAHGMDLESHVSQPLTRQLLTQADYVFAMTHGHLQAAATRFPQAGADLRLLSPRGVDIPDPIGGEQEVYALCAEQIVKCLEQLVPQFRP